jgi:hypothetical protein
MCLSRRETSCFHAAPLFIGNKTVSGQEAESIKHHGVIQPITVRPVSEGFELIAGARCFRATQIAELFSVPARIVQIDNTQVLEWQLVELSVVVKRFLLVS